MAPIDFLERLDNLIRVRGISPRDCFREPKDISVRPTLVDRVDCDDGWDYTVVSHVLARESWVAADHLVICVQTAR